MAAPSPRVPKTGTSRMAPEHVADYLLEIGGDLLAYGCPTHRLEEVIRVVARLEGYRAQPFAVPTGLIFSLSGEGVREPLSRLIRVTEWAVNLDRLAFVDRIFNEVIQQRLTLTQALESLRGLEKRPLPYPDALTLVASAAASGAAAIFFQGGLQEMAFAATGGLALGLAWLVLRRSFELRLLSDFLAGVLAGLFAWLATSFEPTLSREVIVLSVAIARIPGMGLTTSLDELAHKNLVSGAARLMESMIVFLSILFGIAVVVGVEQHFAGPLALMTAPHTRLSLPVQTLTLVVASLSFAVLFQVPRNQVGWALLSGAIGWVWIRVGNAHFPGPMAAFVASLVLCLAANAFARAKNRPAQLFLLPGLILLVPGSFGFRSLEAFLRGDFLHGASTAFDTFLTGGALVTGILVASVLLPAKKIL